MMHSFLKRMGLLLVCLGVVLGCTAAAVNTVDTERDDCTLTVQTDTDELKEETLSVRLYRVADLSAEGTAENPAAEFDGVNFDAFNEISKTDAPRTDALDALTDALAQRVTEGELTPDKTATGTAGVTFENLDTGLYLVLTEPVRMFDHDVVFQPSLISLPTTEDNEEGLHVLQYDGALNLKYERVDLYGDVVIVKTLDSYQADLGTATFVFQVEAEKEGAKVFSDVLTLTFDGAGTRQTVASHIPVGSTVTVTEIYSGASYSLTSDASVTAEVETAQDENNPATVTFTNTYDGRKNSGASVVNHFAYGDAGWEWSPVTDNGQ